jgi:hypothetical protein
MPAVAARVTGLPNAGCALLGRELGAKARGRGFVGIYDGFICMTETNPSAYLTMLSRVDCMLLPV